MTLIFGLRMGRTLLLLGALMATACSLSHLKGDSGSSSKSKPPAGSSAFNPSSDARKDLGDALRKLKTAYPYRLTETVEATMNGQPAMQPSTRVVDFAAADRSHLKWKGGSGGDMEMITFGDKHYWNTNGKWSETASASAGERAKKGADMEKMLAEATKEVKYVGAETVNGVPCFAYAYSLEMNVSGNTYTGKGKAWVGAADGLPHQNDSVFKFSSYEQKSHIVYEYNVNIKVEKPIL